ncbi:glycerophosphodiester phosphodiesterase family protein [Bacilliculturomica massiliensis]|uniref:glycerophosphodiester phosphodiesterase family protein n=1 Tax=Bacilliculturomica massiliensis TaxID=1917867 RepID=UPI0010312D8A|nr:glycerophosphodiester phosphodiesterase family protein [Bacilliculturomica massiliensis]
MKDTRPSANTPSTTQKPRAPRAFIGTLRSTWKTGSRNWTTLLWFEIIYKLAGFILLQELAYRITPAVHRLSGTSLIGQENIGVIFTNPLSLLLLLIGLLALVYCSYFEIAALILCCEAGWRGETLAVRSLWKETFLRSRSFFHYRNLPLVPLLLPLLALAAFPLADGPLRSMGVPEFIRDYLQSDPALKALFFTGIALLNILFFFCLFALPEMVLHGKHLTASLGSACRILRGKTAKTAVRLLAVLCAFAAFSILFYSLFTLLLWFFSKLQPASDGGMAFFQFYFLKWSGPATLALNIFGSAALWAVAVVLYHQCRSEERPRGESLRRTPKRILRRALAITALFVFLVFFSETELGSNPPQYLNPQTQIIAHRAGALFAPENTLSALKNAIAAGADMAEIDVQQTRDGVLVVLHDTNLRRITGVDRNIWQLDYDAVRSLDAGSSFSAAYKGERIPTLEEMLDAARGRMPLMVELKSTGHERELVASTVRQIRKAGMEDQCSVASMSMELLRESKQLAPEIATVYITAVLSDQFSDIPYIDAYSVETSSLTAGMAVQAHAKGKKLYAWTANRKSGIEKILRLGADGLVTDNPELARYYLDHIGEDLLLETLTELLYPSDGTVGPS